MTRQIVVEIVGDSQKFGKAAGDATTQATGLTGKLRGIGTGMVVGAGVASFNLLTTGIGMAIGKLGEAHQAFLDDEVSANKLANSLKNNIPNWDGNTAGAEKFATAAMNMGFADDEARDSLGQLVGVTHDLDEAQKLSALAMDLARAKGIDLATATDIVTKAHEGNGRALKGLGIDIAGAKTGADFLAAAQKNVEGAAASWAQTNTGKLAVSNQKVQEAMEKVGGIIDKVSQVVIPIFADVLTVVIGVLGRVVAAIQPVIATIVNRLTPVVRGLMPIFRTVFGIIETVVRGLAPVFGTVFGVIEKVIGVAGKVIGTVFAGVGKGIGVLQSAFRSLSSFISNIWSGITRVIKGAINGVIGAINAVIGAINGLQVHIHLDTPLGHIGFDWNGLNLRKLAYLHQGGIVPGPPGADVLAILQAGERVTPASQAGATGVTVIVQGNVYGISGVDELSDLIAARLRLQGATAG